MEKLTTKEDLQSDWQTAEVSEVLLTEGKLHPNQKKGCYKQETGGSVKWTDDKKSVTSASSFSFLLPLI